MTNALPSPHDEAIIVEFAPSSFIMKSFFYLSLFGTGRVTTILTKKLA